MFLVVSCSFHFNTFCVLYTVKEIENKNKETGEFHNHPRFIGYGLVCEVCFICNSGKSHAQQSNLPMTQFSFSGSENVAVLMALAKFYSWHI